MGKRTATKDAAADGGSRGRLGMFLSGTLNTFTTTHIIITWILDESELDIFNGACEVYREVATNDYQLVDTLTSFTTPAPKTYRFEKEYDPMDPLPTGNYKFRIVVFKEGKIFASL